MQHINAISGIPAKEYQLLLSTGADQSIKDWITGLDRSRFRKILLQDAIGLEDNINYLPLQPNNLNTVSSREYYDAYEV